MESFPESLSFILLIFIRCNHLLIFFICRLPTSDFYIPFLYIGNVLPFCSVVKCTFSGFYNNSRRMKFTKNPPYILFSYPAAHVVSLLFYKCVWRWPGTCAKRRSWTGYSGRRGLPTGTASPWRMSTTRPWLPILRPVSWCRAAICPFSTLV